MENTEIQKQAHKWFNVPIIATITRLLCRELTLQNEYLLNENKILRSKIKKRLSLRMMNGEHWLNLLWRWVASP